MAENYDRARTLYFDYAGSRFFMSHDGVLDEYRSYGISKAQEEKWRQEAILLYVSRLRDDPIPALTDLETLNAVEASPDLIRFASESTGEAKIVCARVLGKLASSTIWDALLWGTPRAPRKLARQGREVAVRVLRVAAEGPDPELRVWAQRILRSELRSDTRRLLDAAWEVLQGQ